MNRELTDLQNMSNKYGSNPEYVLAGGGNTSYKDENTLYVKGSGTSLATIKAEDFVRLDRAKLNAMWDKSYNENEAKRESEVLSDMMNARLEGETRRPSVETLLHNLFPQKYVLHVHPASVNGMTCGKNGKAVSEKLFPGSVWVDACKPGYILASLCREKLVEYKKETGKDAELLFLQNHGVFFAADTVAEIDALAVGTVEKLKNIIKNGAKLLEESLGKKLSALIGTEYYEYLESPEIARLDPSFNSPTPDHIVYCKANYLEVSFDMTESDVENQYNDFVAKNGYKPRVAVVRGHGAFVFGENGKQLSTVKAVFLDNVKVFCNSELFGGYFGMSDELVDFIVNWEVESYRSKVNS